MKRVKQALLGAAMSAVGWFGRELVQHGSLGLPMPLAKGVLFGLCVAISIALTISSAERR